MIHRLLLAAALRAPLVLSEGRWARVEGQDHGHVVETARCGTEGLAKARAFEPDIVLCDIGLPEMNGFEVVRAMRADPALCSVPVVALSGYAAPADLEAASAAGFDRHLAKPVDLEELEAVMTECSATTKAPRPGSP